MGNRRATADQQIDTRLASAVTSRKKADSNDGQLTESLARGLEILACFDDVDIRLSNLELADRTGLPKPTVSRLTYTLMVLGYLTYSDADGTYGLGGQLLALARPLLSTRGFISVLRPAMKRLAQETGCSVVVGRRAGLSITYINVFQGANFVSLDIGIGSTVPIMYSAMGRAYVAALSKTARAALQKELIDAEVDSAANVRNEVSNAAAALQSQGFCQTLGEMHSDVNAAAVPLRTPGSDDLLLLMCGGPAYILTADVIRDQVGPELIEIGNTLGPA